MRIAIVSSASAGGAGIAALRVAHCLEEHAGLTVEFVDIGAVGAVAEEIAPQRSFSNNRISNTHFTADRATGRREWLVQFLAGFDVVNLHWTSYVLSTSEIEALAEIGTPLLFTLHDFNHVTGGCHYPAGCSGLFAGCMGCPQVEPTPGATEAVHRLKTRKNHLFAHPNLHLAAPSRYVLDAARRAAALDASRAHLLRNPYLPIEDHALHFLPADSQRPFTVLIVADSLVERRKGAPLAVEVLQRFRSLQPPGTPLRIHVAGSADAGLLRALHGLGAEVLAHGRLTDHSRLAGVYAQCDVQLSTSHEDNWPNVLVEAGAYGCLAVVGPGHGCAEFARLYPECPTVDDYAPAGFARALQQLAALHPDELRARKARLRTAVRRDHEPAAVAREYSEALRAVLAVPREAAASAPPMAASTGEMSSNYLGFATREALASAERLVDGRLVVRVVRPSTSAGTLNLWAVYGKLWGEEVVAHSLRDGTTEIRVRRGDATLRHVFATELTDYGLSTLACRLEPLSTSS